MSGPEFLMGHPYAILPLICASFDVTCFIIYAGINRLLGNNTFEAAFPPHEVRPLFIFAEETHM